MEGFVDDTKAKGVNVSLDPDHRRAVRFLLAQEPNPIPQAAIFQRLLEREMWQRFGPDWRIEVRQRTSDLAASAA
jgi:hypothetical protein